MGHQIHYASFETKTDKNIIENECTRYANRYGDGLPSALEFLNKTFDCYDDAEEYLEKHDKEYRNFAVKYKDNNLFKPSAKLNALRERLGKANKDYYEFANKFHFADHKSETVGCKHCGSKIALKYLRGNCCPVCRTDMRPDSVKERIESMKKKAEELQKQYDVLWKEENKKQLKNATEKWLVKIEFHT